MTCPHCSRRLKRRERTDHRCVGCGKGFVFEPRDHPSRVNDVRILRAAAWLAEGGYRFTFGQLAATVSRQGGLPPTFRDTLLSRWPEVHGGLPFGLVDAREIRASPRPAGPATAQVLCPDSDVRTCLLANDAQRRFGVTFVDAEHLPPGPEPVLVLDDDTTRCHRRLADLRRAGRRAVDLGAWASRGTLIRVRPSLLLEWLDLAVSAEVRFRDGARRAAEVDFLNWPGAR